MTPLGGGHLLLQRHWALCTFKDLVVRVLESGDVIVKPAKADVFCMGGGVEKDYLMFTLNISYAFMSSSKHDLILKWPSQPSVNAAPLWRVQWSELHGNALTGFFFPFVFQECPQPLHLSLPLLSREEL